MAKIKFYCKEIRDKFTFKNLLNSIIWVISVIFTVYIVININHLYEPGRAELTINDVEYEIRWLGVRDTNTSEIINSNKYEIKVLTDVTNKEESKYSARITNTSYIILNQNLQVVDHWNSKQEPILIPPQVTLLKVDAHEIRLDPGNYTLLTQIFYEDYKGIRTPLTFRANLTISYRQSKIEYNYEWKPWQPLQTTNLMQHNTP